MRLPHRKKYIHILSDDSKNDQCHSIWSINSKVIGTFNIFSLLKRVDFFR